MKITDLSKERLAALNSGRVATTNLTECLAVDFVQIMRAVLPNATQANLEPLLREAKSGITKRMAIAADVLRKQMDNQSILALTKHPSDTVRGWVCFVIGSDGFSDNDSITLRDRLDAIKPFADDLHFGVREWSWLAVRGHCIADLPEAITHLSEWAQDPSERIRRFACEAIRPRGVWCTHLTALKKNPEQAINILEALRSDTSEYVQDSVGNWLNDASKDQVQWVFQLCERWLRESKTPATVRICRRAQRTIKSKETNL